MRFTSGRSRGRMVHGGRPGGGAGAGAGAGRREPVLCLFPAFLHFLLSLFCLSPFLSVPAGAADALQPGVRGVATRAPAGMKIDGDLSEFRDAFVTPVEYFHDDLRNRAAQFSYMWDDEAFYAGLRTLDQKQANPAPDDRLWEGDAVEWYFDTRRGNGFRGQTWGP